MREACPLKRGSADPKALALERDQIDPGHQEVAPQGRRRNLAETRQRGDDRQVLGLQECDAAVA